MVAELIQKYIYLIQKLIDSGRDGMTISDIIECWQRRFDEPYSRRTFNNHREAIAEIFGIEIECDRSTNTYYIASGEDAIDRGGTLSWMIDTFTVNNLLSLSKERLSGRVQVENVPSGQLHLTSVMSAMTADKEVAIVYRKYTSSDGELLHVQPYAVKEYQKRWYLVGYCHEREAMRVYSLDRIVSLEVTDVKFSMPRDYDVEEAFSASYGPYLPDSGAKPATVTFMASGIQARYVMDLPLHPSQTIIAHKGEDYTFAVRVVPNEDFYMELCRHAGKIVVLSPDSVVGEVKGRLEKATQQYNNI